MTQLALTASNISKKFKIFKSPQDRLKESLALTHKKYHIDFWALTDVSFDVEKGQVMGILGVNGSGKSTLLKIICGYLQPTAGTVNTHGRIASILELGTGFNDEFTGIENVTLYSGMMGFSKSQLSEIMPLVEDFADIGDFFSRPLKLYSSGMKARLAFACTTYMDPDLLIIDEVLAVGDAAFQHKCMNRIKKLQEEGVTILFVSHSIGAIKSLCQEAIILDKGRKIREGAAEDVANYYHGMLVETEEKNKSPRKAAKNNKRLLKEKKEEKKDDSGQAENIVKRESRVGTGEVRIDSVVLKDINGDPMTVVEFNEEVCISTKFTANKLSHPGIFGCNIRDRYGIPLLGTNTAVESVMLPELAAGESCTIDYVMRLPLNEGSYSITVALSRDTEEVVYYDWWDNAYVFEIVPPAGKLLPSCKLYLPIKINIHKENNDG